METLKFRGAPADQDLRHPSKVICLNPGITTCVPGRHYDLDYDGRVLVGAIPWEGGSGEWEEAEEKQLELDLGEPPSVSPARPRIIGLAGIAGSGKSVCSDVFTRAGWKRVKFADGLKTMLRALYAHAGLEPKEIERRIEGDLKETPDSIVGGSSPRRLMQTLGHEWGRVAVSEGFWVDLWEKAATSALAAGFSVVVDDVRHRNELEAIHSLGGHVVGIQRFGAPVLKEPHASEELNFEPDAVIRNDGTVTELLEKTRLLLL